MVAKRARQKLKYTYLDQRCRILNSRFFRAAVYWLTYRQSLSFNAGGVDHIAVFAPPRIGDMAIASSIFHPLKQSFPTSRVSLIANEYVGRMAYHVPGIDNVSIYRGFMKEAGRFIDKMVYRPYDIAIDLNTDYPVESAVIASLSGKNSVGFDIHGRGIFFSESLAIPAKEVHMRDIYMMPLLKIRPDAREGEPFLRVNQETIEKIQIQLEQHGIDKNGPNVVIHPGAHFWTQRWPEEYFASAADWILEDKDRRVLFIGGPGEKELILKIVRQMRKIPSWVRYDLNIDELIGVISTADLMVCNNSGPLHIACAVGTPTISTMGPTVKALWMPLGTGHRVLRLDDLPCIGCNLGYCKIGTHACMRNISPSMMTEAIGRFLKEKNPKVRHHGG